MDIYQHTVTLFNRYTQTTDLDGLFFRLNIWAAVAPSLTPVYNKQANMAPRFSNLSVGEKRSYTLRISSLINDVGAEVIVTATRRKDKVEYSWILQLLTARGGASPTSLAVRWELSVGGAIVSRQQNFKQVGTISSLIPTQLDTGEGQLDIVKTTKWRGVVLDGVDLIADRAAIISRYGADCQDNARLHVKYSEPDQINGYTYVRPEDYTGAAKTLTFAVGNDFSFFVDGEASVLAANDEDYEDGFFDYMNSRGGAYAITSAAKYFVIPHWEISGR